jgi:hypothetical protein
VYALKNGRVIEQGYRTDLEKVNGGEWRSLIDSPNQTKRGDGPVKTARTEVDLKRNDNANAVGQVAVLHHQSSKRPSMRPVTIGGFAFDLFSNVMKSPPVPKVPVHHNSLSPVLDSNESSER